MKKYRVVFEMKSTMVVEIEAENDEKLKEIANDMRYDLEIESFDSNDTAEVIVVEEIIGKNYPIRYVYIKPNL